LFAADHCLGKRIQGNIFRKKLLEYGAQDKNAGALKGRFIESESDLETTGE
jgi:hypothetical protein